jgi:cell division protease FtsH
MVCEFGLSDKVGPVSYSSSPVGYPGTGTARGYSEHTQWLVDQEVAALLTRAEARARDILTRHREALTQLTAALMAQETVTGDQVRALTAACGPAAQAEALTGAAMSAGSATAIPAGGQGC